MLVNYRLYLFTISNQLLNFKSYYSHIQHNFPIKNKKMSRSIPDRWIPYKACGKVIEGTRFICFKVPIKRSVQERNNEITEIWDIDTLLRKIPNLSAVIDLTNTAKYYNPSELQRAGILHKKIYMPGRVIPPEDKVTEFMDAADEFLGKDCDVLVGVHCTHGLNRTGYMVCRYMRDRLAIDAKEAIKRFETARGYKIERDNYIADLLGDKPPPPYVGKSTQLHPIDGDSDKYQSNIKGDSNYQPERRKYQYNGEAWREESRNNGDSSSRGSTGGRFVRHPDYDSKNSWRNDGQGSSARSRNTRWDNDSDRKTRYNTDSDTDDRPYDFKHDY